MNLPNPVAEAPLPSPSLRCSAVALRESGNALLAVATRAAVATERGPFVIALTLDLAVRDVLRHSQAVNVLLPFDCHADCPVWAAFSPLPLLIAAVDLTISEMREECPPELYDQAHAVADAICKFGGAVSSEPVSALETEIA